MDLFHGIDDNSKIIAIKSSEEEGLGQDFLNSVTTEPCIWKSSDLQCTWPSAHPPWGTLEE